MKTEKANPASQFSIFDSIEHLTLTSQNFLCKCDKKLMKPLSKLFSQWEKVISVLVNDRQSKDQEISELKEKYFLSKDNELKLRIKLTHKKTKESEMIKEIQAIKDHLEEGKEMWAKQIKRIEEVMQEQERSKLRIEGLYQQRLSEIDTELDDIMHIHKKKLGLSQNLGEILPGLFSMEELMEEKQIALGEISSRQVREVKINKIEGGSNEDICDDNSEPDMNLDDLTGTQKIIFQRLLELRKKVYKFKHDETTCSETSNASLPLDLKSVSQENFSIIAKIKEKLSRTTEGKLQTKQSFLFCRTAGIIFGLNGSQKYRSGLTDLLKSDKLSISQRENIVFDLINDNLTGKLKTVDKVQIVEGVQQEDWGDMSSIRGEGKEVEVSQDLQSIFSKQSLNLSKVSIVKQEIDSVSEIQDIFEKNIEADKAKIEAEPSKDQEMSSMSILKDFSRNISMSTKRKNSEESHKDPSILDVEDVVSSRKKFSIDQREPAGTLIIPPNLNLYFLPDNSRPRSNPRVTLKPEEPNCIRDSSNSKDLRTSTNFKDSNISRDSRDSRDSKDSKKSKYFKDLIDSRDSSIEDSRCLSKPPAKAENAKKPISMHHKLPILPKPPSEAKKAPVKTFRGRSLQPVQPPGPKVSNSPPGRKIPADIKSASPGTALKFRMRRFKEPVEGKAEKKKEKEKKGKESKSLLVKRVNR